MTSRQQTPIVGKEGLLALVALSRKLLAARSSAQEGGQQACPSECLSGFPPPNVAVQPVWLRLPEPARQHLLLTLSLLIEQRLRLAASTVKEVPHECPT